MRSCDHLDYLLQLSRELGWAESKVEALKKEIEIVRNAFDPMHALTPEEVNEFVAKANETPEERTARLMASMPWWCQSNAVEPKESK